MIGKDTLPPSSACDPSDPDCSLCGNFRGPAHWPDTQEVSRCTLNRVSLAVQLGPDGYRRGVWFCQGFKSKQSQSRQSRVRWSQLRRQLEPGTIYTFAGTNRYLIEHHIADLKPARKHTSA